MRDELLGAILCGLVAWLVWRALQRRKTRTSDWMPHELRASRLAYAEHLFRSAGPVSVSAKVDRAYRDQTGVVTLLELKTRKVERVYLSDVIELSAQRYALQSQTEERVFEHGYVLVRVAGHTPGDVHKVRLLTGKELAATVARRERLLLGTQISIPPRSVGVCFGCPDAKECRAAYPDTPRGRQSQR